MSTPFIPDRRALADALDLIDRYGEEGGMQAAVRAAHSRDAGNVLRFCHWRQIERLIETLACTETPERLH
jgi:hypothetical protein